MSSFVKLIVIKVSRASLKYLYSTRMTKRTSQKVVNFRHLHGCNTKVVKLTDNEVNSAKLQKYRKFVDENYREPLDGKFADDTERILNLIGAQNAGPGEDDDDEDKEHESDQITEQSI